MLPRSMQRVGHIINYFDKVSELKKNNKRKDGSKQNIDLLNSKAQYEN